MQDYKQRSITDLLALLSTQDEWVKVHAAEFLLWETEEWQPVKLQFEAEAANFGNRSPYRIGIWRVLAQSTANGEEKQQWVAKIEAAYRDPLAPDKLHAVETLAKLHHPVFSVNQLEELLQTEANPMNLYALWNASGRAGTDIAGIQDHLVSGIENLASNADFGVAMAVSSYILRYLGPLPTALWHRLYHLADTLVIDPKAHANALATLWITQYPNIDDGLRATVMQSLLTIQHDPVLVNHLFMALAADSRAIPWQAVRSLYDRYGDDSLATYDPDLHASAAYALIRFVKAK